jgi:hypothetical protein
MKFDHYRAVEFGVSGSAINDSFTFSLLKARGKDPLKHKDLKSFSLVAPEFTLFKLEPIAEFKTETKINLTVEPVGG